MARPNGERQKQSTDGITDSLVGFVGTIFSFMTKGTKNAAVSNDDSENSDNELKEVQWRCVHAFG